MLFVRLAGCNVGRYVDVAPVVGAAVDREVVEAGKHSICTTVDGQQMVCDTDYRCHAELTVGQALEGLWEEHVCVTGGEPFIRILAVKQLVEAVAGQGKVAHIETSGTVEITDVDLVTNPKVWITCSPKNGFLPVNRMVVDEWKFVVGPDFVESIVEETVGESKAPVYIQPVNYIQSINEENFGVCRRLQERHPGWRLSLQAHKLFGLR
jgi:organic radical activating enzyme